MPAERQQAANDSNTQAIRPQDGAAGHGVFLAGETIDLVVPDKAAVDNTDWYAWFNDPEVTRFLGQGLYPNSRRQQHAYLDSVNIPGGERIVLLIRAKDVARVVGVASLSRINWIARSAETAIVVGERPGTSASLFYGLEAKALLTRHAFDTMGLERVGGGQAMGLAKWQNLQVLFGFRPEGIARGAFRKGGRVEDQILTGCTRADYERVKAARAGAYWPGRRRLLELMRALPRRVLVEDVRAAIDHAVDAYLAEVVWDQIDGS